MKCVGIRVCKFLERLVRTLFFVSVDYSSHPQRMETGMITKILFFFFSSSFYNTICTKKGIVVGENEGRIAVASRPPPLGSKRGRGATT